MKFKHEFETETGQGIWCGEGKVLASENGSYNDDYVLWMESKLLTPTTIASNDKSKQNIKKIHYQRLLVVINVFLKGGVKTDIDSQIKAIETLNDNLIKTPLFISIIASLKELRGIKRNNNH